jgi:uncharacterized phage-associated protein
MPAPYSSKAIANSFLDIAKEKKSGISPMKMQKLIYFAHGWHLVIFNKPLIKERVEAWQFGPVIPGIYHEFKSYGRGNITDYACDFNFTGDTITLGNLSFDTPKIDQDDKDVKALLGKIWEVYGKLGAFQLSNMTHATGSPWDQVWNKEGGDRPGTDIDDNIIKVHFAEKAAQNKQVQQG